MLTYCLERLRLRTVTCEGKNLIPLINRPLLIYIYIFNYLYLRRLIIGGIAGADWQTVELQVFLSAVVTIRNASVSELL